MGKRTGVVSRLRAKVDEARREATYLVSLGSNRQKRAGMIRFLALLYVARIMPFDTYTWNTKVRLRGARYVVGVRTSEIYVVDEVYGERMYDRLPAYVPRAGWTVVDVGANVGVFTVHAARKGAIVYAFEPNPACFARLRTSHFVLKFGADPGLAQAV
jgi:Met-10+ like-protein